MALPKIFIPKSIVEQAEAFAERKVEDVLRNLFSLIQDTVDFRRRNKGARLHRRALFHQRMVVLLRKTSIRIVNKRGKVARHERLERYWGARAWAYDASPNGLPGMSEACGVCKPADTGI